MNDTAIDDLQERLKLEKAERRPDAGEIQQLRWMMCMELHKHLPKPKNGRPAVAPTEVDTREVLHDAGLEDVLDHTDLVAVWHFHRIAGLPVFAVVTEMSDCMWPQNADIQRAVGTVAEGLMQDAEDLSDEKVASDARVALIALRELTHEQVTEIWKLCAMYGIPPFPAVNKAVRQ